MTSLTAASPRALFAGDITGVNQVARHYVDTSATNFSNGWSSISPYAFATTAIAQDTANVTIDIEKGSVITMTAGPTGFNEGTATLLNAASPATCVWNMDGVSIVATNGAQNGFGQAGQISGAGNTAEVTGFIRNCTFQGYNTSTIFINYALAPLVEFSNNTLINAVFNGTVYGVSFYGLSFDGTIRTLGPGNLRGYTFIEQGSASATNLRWTFYSDFTMAGTGYSTTNQINGNAHVEFNNAFNSVNDIYDMYANNFRSEAPLLTFRANSGRTGSRNTAFVSFSWAPVWRDVFTNVDVADIIVSDLPTQVLMPGVINRGADIPHAVDGPLSTTGYLRYESDFSLNNQLVTIPRALDLDGALQNTYTYSVFTKSFTHMVSGIEVAKVNTPSPVQLLNGNSFTYVDQDVMAAAADTEVGSFTATTAPTVASTAGELYPTAKRSWYENNENADIRVTQSEGVMTFTRNTTIGPTASTAVDTSSISIQTTAVLGFSPSTVNLFLNGTTAITGTIDAVNLPAIALTSSTGDVWNLPNTTGNILSLSGTFTNVTIADDAFTEVIIADNTTLTVAPVSGGLTTLITDSWGVVTVGSGVTINSTALVTLSSDEFISANVTAGTNVTIIAGAANLTTTTFSVPASYPTGRIILKEVGSASGTNVADMVHTGGTLTSVFSVNNVLTLPTTYILYYKPINVLGIGGVAYRTSIVTASNLGTTSVVVVPVVSPIDSGLVDIALQEDISNQTLALGNPATNTSVFLTVAGAVTGVDNQLSLALLLSVTNSENYLRLMANRESTKDLIEAGESGSTLVDARAITLTATSQQIMSAITNSEATGTLVASITAGGFTFLSIIILPSIGGITVSEIVAGVRIENTTIRNALGWEVAEGDDELIGLAPNAAYVPGTDYTGNL